MKPRITVKRILLLVATLAVFATGTVSETTPKANGGQGLLLVVNKGDRTLSIVDLRSGRQLVAVPVGGTTGHEVAASPDSRAAWVPIYGDSGVGKPGTDGRTVSVIDLKSRMTIASVDLGEPSRPHSAVFGPRDGKMYVTSELTHSIKVVDPTTRKVVRSIPTGEPESHMLAISSDGRRGYTANVGSGTISAINMRSGKLIAMIPVAKVVQRIAISTDDRWVFTADQTKPQIAVINARTNKVWTWISLPGIGFGLTPTHNGLRLLVTHPTSDSVSVVNLKALKVERTIHVPADPQEIVVPPNDHTAYVSCDESKQVAAIDLASGRVEQLIDVGAGADGLAWVPLSEQGHDSR